MSAGEVGLELVVGGAKIIVVALGLLDLVVIILTRAADIHDHRAILAKKALVRDFHK